MLVRPFTALTQPFYRACVVLSHDACGLCGQCWSFPKVKTCCWRTSRDTQVPFSFPGITGSCYRILAGDFPRVARNCCWVTCPVVWEIERDYYFNCVLMITRCVALSVQLRVTDWITTSHTQVQINLVYPFSSIVQYRIRSLKWTTSV